MKSGKILKGAVIGLTCMVVSMAIAKNSKPIVPGYVLQAHSVAVVIDPDAGVSFDNPRANETARKDVETAISNWGRFTTVLGPQHGSQPGLSDDTPSGSRSSAPQLEVGNTEDSFVVHAGSVDHPLDGPAGWRWMRKDALHPHDVPAVAEFRKAIEEAEKQAAKQPKHP